MRHDGANYRICSLVSVIDPPRGRPAMGGGVHFQTNIMFRHYHGIFAIVAKSSRYNASGRLFWISTGSPAIARSTQS